MNREQDRLLREAMERREGEAGSVQGELDDLLREAMERRAERVPALSADFQERVMARLRPLTVSPQGEEGHARRRGLRRLWPWVGNIAAAVVVGWFVFFGYDRLDGLNGPDEGTANDSALAQETAVTELPTPVSSSAEPHVYPTPAFPPSQAPQTLTPDLRLPLKGAGSQSRSSAKAGTYAQQVSVSTPSLQGRAGGGSITEQTLHADMSAFHASLEEIEREALQEVNTAMCEALGQVYGATSPS